MSILFDHHIILERFRGHRAFNDIDKQMFDIDAPENRIYLPADQELAANLNVSPHPSRHLSSYGESVCKALNQIADIPSPGDRAAEIRTLIDAMRVGFANGDLYVNMPIGKTREEVDRSIARVLTDHKAYLSQYPDQLKAIRELEQRGANAGKNHLIKWLLYLDNPERQKLLDDVIARNPGINLTAGNQDLEGTPWQSKFAALDPSSSMLRIPGSTAAEPSDFPPLPGYSSPSFAGLNEQERFAPIDPRFTGVLESFPAPNPNEQGLGQLPPTTASPPDPLIFTFDPATGAPLPFSERSPILDPGPPSSGTPPVALYGAATIAALLAIAPEFAPLWAALGAAAVMGTAPARGTGTKSKGVLSVGTTPYNAFTSNDLATPSNGSSSLPPALRSQAEDHTLDREPERASTFADRFESWISTPAGTIPTQVAPAASGASVAEAAAPEEVRRLTRVNASNAGSVFTSGSAPVPYLPSTELNDRFGNWTVPTADGGPRQTSKPIGVFAAEPSYLIPPPIFGVDGPGSPRNDAEEWFSHWIRPLLRPD